MRKVEKRKVECCNDCFHLLTFGFGDETSNFCGLSSEKIPQSLDLQKEKKEGCCVTEVIKSGSAIITISKTK